MKIKKLKVEGDEWCEVEIKLRDRNGKLELSITGTCGYVTGKRAARRDSQEYWESFFEDDPDQIRDMNERMGTNFRSPRSAARYVREHDGEFHGMDVHDEYKGKLLICTGAGQIREEINRFFPEVKSLYRWHLNGMQSGCVHQALQGQIPATSVRHAAPNWGKAGTTGRYLRA
jgi:hypothetical protein